MTLAIAVRNMEVVRCVCDGLCGDLHFLQCSTCREFQHRVCVGPIASMSMYECARCQVIKCSPSFEVCGFQMPPRLPNTDVTVGPLADLSRLRLLLVCLRLTPEGCVADWSANPTVTLDNQILASPQGDFHDITAHPPQHIKFESTEGVLWTLVLARRRSMMEVKRSLHYAHETNARSVDLLFANRTLDKAQIRLLPQRNSTPPCPVRGSECTHFQCFDYHEFLEKQQQSTEPTWRCPECSKRCVSFRFDEVQQAVQRQCATAVAVNVRPVSQVPEAFQLPPGPFPDYSFRDFLAGKTYAGKIPEAVLYQSEVYSAINLLWTKLNGAEEKREKVLNSLGVEVWDEFSAIEVD